MWAISDLGFAFSCARIFRCDVVDTSIGGESVFKWSTLISDSQKRFPGSSSSQELCLVFSQVVGSRKAKQVFSSVFLVEFQAFSLSGSAIRLWLCYSPSLSFRRPINSTLVVLYLYSDLTQVILLLGILFIVIQYDFCCTLVYGIDCVVYFPVVSR